MIALDACVVQVMCDDAPSISSQRRPDAAAAAAAAADCTMQQDNEHPVDHCTLTRHQQPPGYSALVCLSTAVVV